MICLHPSLSPRPTHLEPSSLQNRVSLSPIPLSSSVVASEWRYFGMFRRPSSYVSISSPFHIAAVSLSSSLGFWFSICPLPVPSPSLSPTVCHLAAVDQTGRLPLFMTADMWQFPFVNDKKCANYLSGCFAANQSLTSCECAAMFACVCVRACACEPGVCVWRA